MKGRMRVAFIMMTACATHLAASAKAPEGPVKVSGWTVSDRRDADGHYVGFARDRGEKDVFAVERPETRLTEESAHPVRLKVDDDETLVTGDVALDNKMQIVPFQEPQKLFQKPCKGSSLYVGVLQEAAGSD